MPWAIIALPAAVFLILGIINGLKEEKKLK